LDEGGHLTLNSSTISHNTNDAQGAGIRVHDGTVRLNNSALIDNVSVFGGGLDDEAGKVTLNNSTVSHNTATFGAGLNADTAGAALTLNNSRVSSNVANSGGGIFTAIPTTLNSTTVTENRAQGNGPATGAGIVNGTNQANLQLNASKVTHNQSTGEESSGAGLVNGGTATLRASEITNNTAVDAPGGIYNLPGKTVSLVASRVSANIPTNCAGSPEPVAGCTN
jgi:hypothetical protein